MIPIPVILLVCLLLLTAPLARAETAIRVTTLAGHEISGHLLAWSGDEVQIKTATETQTLPTESLLQVVLPDSQSGDASSSMQLELIDGSVLQVEGLYVSGSNATFTFAGKMQAAAAAPTISASRVASLRLESEQGNQDHRWSEFRHLQLPGDVLVVRNRQGTEWDYLEGIVGDISDAHVQFEFDGEQIPVKRGKVVGVIYYRPRTEELPPARCVVHLVDGSRLAARETNNQSTGLMVTTSAGFARLVPWDAIDWVDFSAGKVTYLSDLEPLKVDWAPLVGLPDSAKQAKAFGMPRFDRGFYGESLRLEFHAADSSHQTSEARSFAKGIAARSRSELVYRVPPGHSAFRAWAGINPQFFEQGHVRLAVFGDGETLLQADIDGRRPPLEINVPIFGVRRLRLLVDYGENLDFGDVLHLADAQFTK